MDSRPLPELSVYLGRELLNPVVQSDPKLKLRCMVTKGEVDLEIDPATSQKVWEEVQTLAKSLGDKAWEARAKGKLAYIAFFDGEMAKARKLALDAGLSAMLTGDLAAQSGYITLIAYAMNELNRYDEGLQFSDQALAMAESNKELGFPFRAYAAKAKALFALGKRSEATQFLRTGLEQTKLLRSRLYETYFLIELGLQSKAAGSSSQAVEHLEAAGSLAREGGFYHSLAWSMFELARIYRDQQELPKAEERAMTALRAMRQVGDRYHLPLHLALSAELKMAIGALTEADDLYEQATDVTEGMLANVPDLQTKSSLIAVMSDIYLGHFNLAASSLKDYNKAFRVLERARGRTIADSLRNRSTESAQKVQAGELSMAEKELGRLNQRLLRSERSQERRDLLNQLWFEEQRIDPVVESPNQFQKLVLHKNR
jgi:tetratricopeptide (TPR) repeat protein